MTGSHTTNSDGRKKPRAVPALFAAIALLLPSAGSAQPSLTSSEAETLYAQILTDPGNRDLNLRFSALMATKGDYEAAIPPLERILLREPENAWLQMQLGNLYKALGSKAMARTYLDSVLHNPKASPEVVGQARQTLSEM